MLYCRNDVGVGTTAADVAPQLFSDFGLVLNVSFAQHTNSGADLPWRAIAALVSIVIDEGLLHRREIVLAA